MQVAKEIGQYKQENNLPVYDPERERQVLVRQASKVEPALQMPVRLSHWAVFLFVCGFNCDIIFPEYKKDG